MSTEHKIVRRRIEMYAVQSICNKLRPDLTRCPGQHHAVAALGILFQHRCDLCGDEKHLSQQYPHMDHVFVDDEPAATVSLISVP